MDFEALPADLLADTAALNSEFLALATASPATSLCPPGLRELLVEARPLVRQRLARVPFLLLVPDTLAGNGWAPVRRRSGHLLDVRTPSARQDLVTATIALLWMLAETNRYAGRLLSGAPAGWLDALASRPLVDALATADAIDQPLVPRFADEPDVWRTLLVASADERPYVRRACRFAAAQRAMFTASAGQVTAVAARCRDDGPRRITDRPPPARHARERDR